MKTTLKNTPSLMTVICNIQDMSEIINLDYDRHKDFKRLEKMDDVALYELQNKLIPQYNDTIKKSVSKIAQSKHTQGEWYVSKHTDSNETVIRSKDGDIIANVDCDGHISNVIEVQANAKLIALAPQMLDVIKYVAKAMDSPEFDGGNLSDYQAALNNIINQAK